MKKENCKRKKVGKTKDKTMAVSIRITPHISKWLRENDFSPTGIFYEALSDLGYKPKK